MLVVLLLRSSAPASALAWSGETCLTPGSSGAGSPCLRFAPDGTLHAVYQAKYAVDTLYHSVWMGTYWSAPEALPGPGYKTTSSQMDIGPDGHVHVVGIFRVDGTSSTPYTVYHWEHNGASWIGPTQLSDGQGDDSDSCTYPRIGVDRFNNVHVVWSEGNRVGGKADLMYRRRVGGVWQPAVNLTNNGASVGYGSCNPDMCVEKNGDGIHIVWHDGFTGKDLLYYMKSPDLGTTWPSSAGWTRISGDQYGKGPTLVLDRFNRPNVWWTDLKPDGVTKFNAYRRWDGAAWTPIMDWGSRVCFDAAFDASNLMRVTYRTDADILYNTFNFTNFGSEELIGVGPDTYKADAGCIVLDSTDSPWVLWAERKGEWPGVGAVYFSTAAQLPPPESLVSFSAVGSDSLARLYWTNPPSINCKRVLIRCKCGGFPSNPTDGTLVCDRSAEPNASDSFVHSGLVNDLTYYYAAWVHDGAGRYSTARYAAAVPRGVSIGEIKQLSPDGTAVDLLDKVVTAVFSADAAVYVQDISSASGIRVAHSGAGLAVGDRVNVSGTLSSRVLSGQKAERVVTSAVVTKVASGSPVRPLAMKCRSVGGGDMPPYLLGVGESDGRRGQGMNNIGLLVCIAGRVKAKLSSSIWVDDGGNIKDYSGNTGVLVRCPDTNIPVSVGDMVRVVGVVEGSIPVGWTTNRRCVHIRSYDDLRKISN